MLKSAVACLALFAAPAAAGDFCHDLWYTRNAIMDQAGYCFGSALGQAVFGTGPCIGKSVSLTPQDQQRVAQIQGMERDMSCRVNTKQHHLDLDDLHIRRQLSDLPIPDEIQGACLGWMGPATALHAGHSEASPVIGQILPDDTVSYSHWPDAGWTYVTTSAGHGDWRVKSGGWLNYEKAGEVPCRDFAG
ncbi:DUF4453 domain-containing protein [Phaeobacter gallaeciensis]|uniref:DUF4453 domain-containing protein n=1 Tax=Phaeobacter gallaeciensis TaxID=60890 RepID=UPI00237F2D02|nr:DUF4453 domain-containing protein [Phaeobacter gallaeciensis]MEC9311641.1 DUF4453 domain-containing protein [Pseudomonadota bacterium]MDE4098813.1 DUF4453 domain-containing protein [Phaeobacter gallaeciensis]MDE4107430.1 DUF4453 domain-containing protein [Phaeobacter gallaeciensis]MDE4111884.1 DUF4453 domain-containing protein [Phaeobacter gallaeciensis]MDE4116548.1 DUF4453 domain-containing protein [Phaeobacter gallaeciensis]